MKLSFSSLLVFGYGLNDMGRWGKLTGYRYPPSAAGFMDGRWTNGKVWIELVADALGLTLSFDNNFAMGGATTGSFNINESLRHALELDVNTELQGMLAQVESYLKKHPQIDDSTLCVLWAGGHDIGNYLEYGQPDLERFPPAENYRQAISILAGAGARHILVGTMPDMGFSPGYFGTDKQQKASALSQSLNEGLSAIELDYANSELSFYRFDGAAVFERVGMAPADYGFKYAEAFLPLDIINFSLPLRTPSLPVPNSKKGLDPDEFMNWWAVSASARMHQVLANEALKYLDSTR